MKKFVALILLMVAYVYSYAQPVTTPVFVPYTGSLTNVYVPIQKVASNGTITNLRIAASQLTGTASKLDSITISNDSVYTYANGTRTFVSRINTSTSQNTNDVDSLNGQPASYYAVAGTKR